MQLNDHDYPCFWIILDSSFASLGFPSFAQAIFIFQHFILYDTIQISKIVNSCYNAFISSNIGIAIAATIKPITRAIITNIIGSIKVVILCNATSTSSS